MGKYKYLLKNIGLITIGSFAAKLLTFFILPLYTSFLSTAQYALIDLMNLAVNLFVPVLTMSIADGVLRFTIENSGDRRKTLSIGLLMVGCGAVVLLLTMPLWGQIVMIWQYRAELLVLFALTAADGLLSGYFKAIDRIRLMVLNSLLATVVTITLNVLLIAVFRQGVRGYLIAVIAGLAASTVSYVWRGRVWEIAGLRFLDKALLKRMVCYCVPLMPNAIFWWINSSSDRYLLMYFTTLSVVGLYAVAGKIPALLNVATGILQQAWMLSAFREFGKPESEAFFHRIYRVFDNIMLLGSAALVFGSRALADFLFQKDFYQAWVYVPFLVLAFYYSAMSTFLGTGFTASKRTKQLFTTTCLGAGLNILLNLCLIRSLGAIGSGIATAMSYFLIWIIRSVSLQKIMRLRYDYVWCGIAQMMLLGEILLTIGQAGLRYRSVLLLGIIVVSGQDLLKNIRGARQSP